MPQSDAAIAGATKKIEDLPVEVLGLVSRQLSKKDLLSTRLSTHALQDGCSFDFVRRFLTDITTPGTVTNVQTITTALQSANLSAGKNMLHTLNVPKPQRKHMPDNGHTRPSAEEVARLFEAVPQLQVFKCGHHCDRGDKMGGDKNDALIESRDIASVFLGGLAAPRSNVTRLSSLSLTNCYCDDGVLQKVLQTQSLREVSLHEVTLYGQSATWPSVLEVLLRLHLKELAMNDLVGDDTGGAYMVMLKNTRKRFETRTSWNPDGEDGEYYDGTDENGEFVDTGLFGLHGCWLHGIWTKKGLENLLGIGNHFLYAGE